MSSTSARLGAFVIELGSFDPEDWWALARTQAEAAVRLNRAWLERHRVPLLGLVELGVRYVPTRNLPIPGLAGLLAQPIRLAPVVLRDKIGSCLDLAAYVAAVERCRGRKAKVEIQILDDDTAHAIVVCDHFTIDATLQVPRVAPLSVVC